MTGHSDNLLLLRKTVLALWLSTAAFIIAAFVSAANAHEIKPAIADLGFYNDNVTVEIDLVLEPIIAGLDLSAILNTNDSPKAALHDALRADEPQILAEELRKAWPRISSGIALTADGAPLAIDLTGVDVGPIGDVSLPRDSHISLMAALPADATSVQLGWDASYGAIVVRQVSDDPDTAYTGYLTGGQTSEPIPRAGTVDQPWIVLFTDYIRIGYGHIVPQGLDHILFVLGLFFFSLQMRPLLWQISAFTLAHTTTLALASLGLVSVPPTIVQPLIALSIAYVAVENVFVRKYHQWRTVVVFCFGLLHGLGFASMLGDIGLEPSRFLTGLIGFNIGVELGQLSVIAAAWLMLASWAGQKSWYRPFVATPASIAIALVGAYWLAERTIL